MIDKYNITFWILCIIFTVFLAKKKGRSILIWFVVSLLLGIFAAIGILFARNLNNNKVFGLNRNDSIIAFLLLIALSISSIPTIQKIYKKYLIVIKQKKKSDEMYKQINTQIRLHYIREYLEMYRKDHGKYPSSLKALTDYTDDEMLIDKWGRPFRYIPKPDSQGRPNQSYELYSAGKDGLFNTEDDLYGIEISK